MLDAINLPRVFYASSKEIFIFDKDAAQMIGNSDGISNVRDVIEYAPYDCFAVDLGDGTGFYFYINRSTSHVFSIESVFGNDPRDDDILVHERPNYTFDNKGGLLAFDWFPTARRLDEPTSKLCVHDVLHGGGPSGSIMSLAFVENIVAYLCCINAEINTVYSPSKTLHSSKKRVSKATWHEVGFRLGASIRAYNYERSKSVKSNACNKGSIRPHMRRAHWHHYWTGSHGGSRKLVLKWIAPILVGCDDVKLLSATGHCVKEDSENI